MRWAVWLPVLLLAGSCGGESAGGSTDVLDRVLEGFVQLRRATDFNAHGRLVRTEDPGRQTSHEIRIKSRCFGERLLLYWEIAEPSGLRWRVLADTSPGREPTLRLAPPGTATAELLPPARWADSLAGTHLSFEDLLDQHLFWKTQTLLPREKVGARECFVVRSEPGTGDLTRYAHVTTWLDTTSYVPIRLEKRLPDGTLKRMISRGIRYTRGTWTASQLEVTVSGDASRTLLTMTGGSAKAGLQMEEFSLSGLFAPE